MTAASGDAAWLCLLEACEKVQGSVLTVWSAEGKELASLGRGEDRLLEVGLEGGGAVCWSSDGVQGYVGAPPESAWLWVIRASEGHVTTTWRFYHSRPPVVRDPTCPQGHALHRGFGASGIMRVVSGYSCKRCGTSVRNGLLRWSCQACDFDLCLECMEQQAWRATNGHQELYSLEDFVDLDGVGSPSSPASPAAPSPFGSGAAGGLGAEVRGPRSRGASAFPAAAAAAATPRSAASSRNRERAESLQAVPFIGVRPLGQIQGDTTRRLRRLLEHGDAQGARRTLARARQLGVAVEDLATDTEALKQLEAEGDFRLLLQ